MGDAGFLHLGPVDMEQENSVVGAGLRIEGCQQYPWPHPPDARSTPTPPSGDKGKVRLRAQLSREARALSRIV